MSRKAICGQETFFSQTDVQAKALKLNNLLQRLNVIIPWEDFRPLLASIRKDSKYGRPSYDEIFLFKCIVLQDLNNLSDAELEYQILVRLDFRFFLGMNMASDVPDSNTFWNFRKLLEKDELIKRLFKQFEDYLRDEGLLLSKRGCIMDATFVDVPRQRNTREENQAIRESKPKKEIFPNKSESSLRHKDTDAAWAVKGKDTFYGFKNHVVADEESKFIMDYSVTPANVFDGAALPSTLPEATRLGQSLFADSAYYSRENIEEARRKGYTPEFCEKGCRYAKLSDVQKRLNKEKSRRRCRIEHIFGNITNRHKGLKIHTVGLKRAIVKIGIMNLVYNFTRLVTIRSME